MTDVTRFFALTCITFILSGCSLLETTSHTNDDATDEAIVLPTDAAPEDDMAPPVAISAVAPDAPPVLQDDLWEVIRDGFAFRNQQSPQIDQYVTWYASHQRYIDRITERGQRYLFHIVARLQEEGLPLEIALLPVVESAFDPFAYSHATATGMWQFMSGTARDYGLKQNWWYDGRRDVIDSTDAAIAYLQRLHAMFNNDWMLALAAYNTGQGRLLRAIEKNRKAGKPTDFWSLKLPRETRAYVPQLMALARIIAKPDDYGVSLPALANNPYFITVETGSQLDLAEAASLAGITMDELYLLNPGFNRWATDPEGPHRLLLPVATAGTFSTALAEIPSDQRVSWQRYTIKSGDSLIKIAQHHNTSVEALKTANQLKSSRIRAGATLLIPSASQADSHYALSQTQRLQKKQASAKGAPGSQRIEYTVQSGDSFWRIANRHQVTVSALTRWNGLAPRDKIKPGQKLVIWTKSTAAKATGSLAQTNRNVTRKLSYKVRQGDSLARIASRFNVKISDITRWNSVSTKGYIHPGQLLTLFVDVTGRH